MALSNYTELKASIADYLNRSDLTAAIPDFISLTEAKLKRRYKDFSPLSASNANNWILTSYPDVYLYGALLEASPYLVEDQRVDVWAQLYAAAVGTLRGTVGNADFDDYDGLKLAVGDWLARADLDGVVPQLIKLGEAKLFRKFDGVTALTSSNTTNWILTNHPDLYLYASLSEAAPYLGQDDRLQVWRTLYEAEVGRIRKPKSGVNLDDYNGLKAAIADWLERYDLDDVIPDFIQLAEARIKRRVRDITPLTAVETTNWMLTNHPDVYLFGSLVEAIPYVGNDERIPLWQAKYDAAFVEVRRPNTSTSLDTYTGLKLAIADWLDRPDLDDIIPQFIEMAEAQMSRDIRHYEMENRATADVDGQYLQRPSDWVETIRLHITSGGTRNLQLLSAAAMADKRQGVENATGEPKYYRHVERGFELFPTADGTYEVELLYYQKIPALTSSNADNWLLLSHPDVYLYGSLIHAAPYIKDDQRAATWAQLYSAALARVNESGSSASQSGTGLTLKVRGLG